MGWYYQPIGGRSTADKDAFLRSEIEQIADTPGKPEIKVVKSAFVGSTWYAAVLIGIPDQTPYTVAYVYLTQMGRDGDFGYKPMDESVGPCEVDCPIGIMNLLTPIDQLPGVGYAADWRARVAAAREHKAGARRQRARIVSGTRLRFATPLRFTDGTSYDRFVAEAMSWRRRTIIAFRPVDAEDRPLGGRYRIRARVLATAEIETAERTTSATPTLTRVDQIVA